MRCDARQQSDRMNRKECACGTGNRSVSFRAWINRVQVVVRDHAHDANTNGPGRTNDRRDSCVIFFLIGMDGPSPVLHSDFRQPTPIGSGAAGGRPYVRRPGLAVVVPQGPTTTPTTATTCMHACGPGPWWPAGGRISTAGCVCYGSTVLCTSVSVPHALTTTSTTLRADRAK